MERVGGKERKYQVDGRSFCSTIVEFCVFVCGSRRSVGVHGGIVHHQPQFQVVVVFVYFSKRRSLLVAHSSAHKSILFLGRGVGAEEEAEALLNMSLMSRRRRRRRGLGSVFLCNI